MKKVTKKELVEKANDHELRIFRIEKALEKHGINWFVEEPKPKQLDQSVFDGQDEKYRWAAIEKDSTLYLYAFKPFVEGNKFVFHGDGQLGCCKNIGTASPIDWQNSLIERDKVELTGSDLTEQIMKKQKYQPAFVSDESEQDAINSQRTALVDNVYMSDRDYRFRAELNGYRYAIPINNQGEPLTQSEAGL